VENDEMIECMVERESESEVWERRVRVYLEILLVLRM
jgi:hypothetical protein